MGTKTCSDCRQNLPIEQYYVYKKKGYTYNWCKQCHYKRTKPLRERWVIEYPDKARKVTANAMRMYVDRCTPGVYLLETTKGNFIGHSKSIETRMVQITAEQTLFPLQIKAADLISYTILEVIEDKQERSKRKEYFIDLIQPSLNKRLK